MFRYRADVLMLRTEGKEISGDIFVESPTPLSEKEIKKMALSKIHVSVRYLTHVVEVSPAPMPKAKRRDSIVWLD